MADRALAGMIAGHQQHEAARRARDAERANRHADATAHQRARFADLLDRILTPVLVEHTAQLADVGITLTVTAGANDVAVTIRDARRAPLEGTIRLDVGAMLDSDVAVTYDRLVWLGPADHQWCSALDQPDVVDLWARAVLHGFYRTFFRTT